MKITSPVRRPIFRLLPKACAAAALIGLSALPSAHAASGTWSSLSTGNWSTAGNWNGGVVADGSGNTAFFNALDLTANVTVHLDTARTIGSLNIGDTTATFFNYTIDNNSSGANVLTLAGGTPTITVATSNTATISAEISGTSGLVKAGGGNLILSGVNTYSGTTSVTNSSGGFVQFNADSAFGSSTLLVSSQNGGLKFGAVVNDLRAITFSSLGGGGRIDTSGFDITYSSTLSGTIGAGNFFTKIGNGTLTLAGTNNIGGAGGVNVSGGFLQIDSNARLGNGTGGLTLNISGGGIKFGAAFNDLRATTLGTSGGTLDTNGFSVTVSSTIASTGAGALVKAGSGTLTLTANNTYAGPTTVNAGTLLINGTHSGTGAVTVASTAALGGTGAIAGATTINSGGKLGALDGSGNAFTLSNASAVALNISAAVGGANTGALVFELGSVANSDKIVLSSLTSGLSIGTAVLNFNDFSFTALSGFGGGTYTLFDTNTAITGTLGSSLTGTINGLNATISLGDSGHDIVLTVAVPEPSTVAMLTLGGVGCLVWRIRRRIARS